MTEHFSPPALDLVPGRTIDAAREADHRRWNSAADRNEAGARTLTARMRAA